MAVQATNIRLASAKFNGFNLHVSKRVCPTPPNGISNLAVMCTYELNASPDSTLFKLLPFSSHQTVSMTSERASADSMVMMFHCHSESVLVLEGRAVPALEWQHNAQIDPMAGHILSNGVWKLEDTCVENGGELLRWAPKTYRLKHFGTNKYLRLVEVSKKPKGPARKSFAHDFMEMLKPGVKIIHGSRGVGHVLQIVRDANKPIHVRFEDGEVHRYSQQSAASKFKLPEEHDASWHENGASSVAVLESDCDTPGCIWALHNISSRQKEEDVSPFAHLHLYNVQTKHWLGHLDGANSVVGIARMQDSDAIQILTVGTTYVRKLLSVRNSVRYWHFACGDPCAFRRNSFLFVCRFSL